MPEENWFPPPPTHGEGALRKKKLDAAIAAIQALSDAFYAVADPVAVLLRLDRHWIDPSSRLIDAEMGVSHHEPEGYEPWRAGDRLFEALQDARAKGAELDLAFVEAELRQLARTQAGRPWPLERGVRAPAGPDSVADALGPDILLVRRLKECLAEAAENTWLVRPKAASREEQRASARAQSRKLLQRLTPALWSAVEPLADDLYEEWRNEMFVEVKAGRMRLAFPEEVPPARRTIPIHALVSGRYGRWRPRRALHRCLAADYERRLAPPATNAPPGQKLVRLIRPAPAQTSASPRLPDKWKQQTSEASRLREALERPRPLAPAGDVDARIAGLYARFPWWGAILDALRRDMIGRSARRHGAFSFSPVLLVGPPASGKSRFARELAAAFAAPYRRIDRAGESDARDFLGTSRGWSSEAAAAPTLFLSQVEVANPLLHVDEIDKETPDARNGSVHRGLLAMLEPTTASTWRDPLLGEEVDISHINWVLSANALASLRGPLLSRVTIHEVGQPGLEHFDALLASMLKDVAEQGAFVFEGDAPTLDSTIREGLRRRFEKERLNARQLQRLVAAAIAAGQVVLERGRLN